jgi:putative Mg2+ transporter-C (MgtC) family protein
MTLTTEDAVIRIVVALLLGAAIGIERQWNRHASGLRTSALISIGAALFVLLSLGFPGEEASATRVAAQVVSGVGFLGAGVILRDGINVRGLTTAATMWSAAAVGTLAAAGMFAIAAFGATAVIAANVVLQPVKRVLDRRAPSPPGALVRYELHATCRATQEAHVRGLLVGGLVGVGQRLRGVSAHASADGRVELIVELVAGDPDDDSIEQVVRLVGLEPEVLALRWEVRSVSATSGQSSGSDDGPASDRSVRLIGRLRALRRR